MMFFISFRFILRYVWFQGLSTISRYGSRIVSLHFPVPDLYRYKDQHFYSFESHNSNDERFEIWHVPVAECRWQDFCGLVQIRCMPERPFALWFRTTASGFGANPHSCWYFCNLFPIDRSLVAAPETLKKKSCRFMRQVLSQSRSTLGKSIRTVYTSHIRPATQSSCACCAFVYLAHGIAYAGSFVHIILKTWFLYLQRATLRTVRGLWWNLGRTFPNHQGDSLRG